MVQSQRGALHRIQLARCLTSSVDELLSQLWTLRVDSDRSRRKVVSLSGPRVTIGIRTASLGEEDLVAATRSFHGCALVPG